MKPKKLDDDTLQSQSAELYKKLQYNVDRFIETKIKNSDKDGRPIMWAATQLAVVMAVKMKHTKKDWDNLTQMMQEQFVLMTKKRKEQERDERQQANAARK